MGGNQNQTANRRTKSAVGAGQPQRTITRVGLFLALLFPHLRSRSSLLGMQRLLCTAPRGHAHPDDEPRPVPRPQVPRKDRAGVPPALGQLPDQRHDGFTAHRHAERRPKVACGVFAAVVAATAHFTAGRGAQASHHPPLPFHGFRCTLLTLTLTLGSLLTTWTWRVLML